MVSLRRIIIIFILILIGINMNIDAQSQHRGWQETVNVNTNFKAVASKPEIEVFTAPKVVMIRTNQNIEVRIFTILGKLVNVQRVGPGNYEYHLDAPGIYIIKTDEFSCKVAV